MVRITRVVYGFRHTIDHKDRRRAKWDALQIAQLGFMALLIASKEETGPNKFTGALQEAIQVVYDRMDGHDAFLAWAKENQTEYYKIASRLLPVEMREDGKDGISPSSLSARGRRFPSHRDSRYSPYRYSSTKDGRVA